MLQFGDRINVVLRRILSSSAWQWIVHRLAPRNRPLRFCIVERTADISTFPRNVIAVLSIPPPEELRSALDGLKVSVCASPSNARRPNGARQMSGKFHAAQRNATRRSVGIGHEEWKNVAATSMPWMKNAGMSSAVPQSATLSPEFGRMERRCGNSS